MNNNEKSKKMRSRIPTLLLALFMLLSIMGSGVSSVAATNEAEIPETIGKYQGDTDIPFEMSEWISRKEGLSDEEKKLSEKILQLTDSKYLPAGITQSQLINEMKEQKQLIEAPEKNGSDGSSSGLNVYVYIKLKKGSDIDILSPHIYEMVNKDTKSRLAVAWVDVKSLEEIASLKGVQSIREVYAPIVHTGSLESEGVFLHKTDQVISQTGADGSGVKIGIISDGVDNYSSAVSSGDLPSDVTILSNAEGGDEGTAMLEIVHDLAPGSKLYFHDCGSSVLDFCDSISALVSAGCDVVCDDIGWLREPFFEDGTVALHLQSLLSSNDFIYVSSAGNAAKKHYQGLYVDRGDGVADFSGGSNPSVPHLYAKLPPGGYINVVMQWNDSFGSSGNDYDLYAANLGTGNIIAGSTFTQDGNDDPLEYLFYQNQTGSTINVAILANAYDNPSVRTLEVFSYTGYGAVMYIDNLVKSDSIFGHAAVPGVLSCGAIDQADPDTIESFSSQGPVTMLTGSRQKPDICGIDGVTVTGAGGFPSPFYGTSAAAPHIAAIAAVLESRFPTMTTSEIKQLILDYAEDLGDGGYDNIYGYGLSDALDSALSHLYVDFDTRGGSAVDTQLIENGNKPTEPSDPVKSGYRFMGWYKEEACNNIWNFNTDVPTSDTTIFASWDAFEVTISDDTKDMAVGDTYQLSYSINPPGAVPSEVTWSTNKSHVATVDQTGLVTAVGGGVAEITVTADGVCDSCIVTVEAITTDEVIGGKLHRTYYNADGSIQKVVIYYGPDDTSVVEKINYYTNGVRTSYRLYNTSGQLTNYVELYSDGKTKKINYYNPATGTRTAYKLYDTEGRMTHYIYCYSDGIKPKKTNYYNVTTGIRTSYKLYDTAGRTTHLVYCHPGGVKPKKLNYYNVSTGIRTSYKLYDTAGRTTHYAVCYSDGIAAKKMNYYNVNTGIRSAYKTYRTNGTVTCYVKCDSNGDPSVATYYDEDGNVTKVVHY